MGTECPGQVLVRARVSQRFVVRRRGRAVVRTRMVRRSLARRAFRLTGGRSHTFRIGLGRHGHQLTRTQVEPRAHLLVAIPGGKVGRELRLK